MKNCRFENVGAGVWTEYAGSSDFYIADNLFLGRDDRFRLVGWTGPLWASAGPYGSHLLKSYYAVKVYGPGHVIAHNAIAYFHDGIGISTYGTPEQDPERRASSIDIYNNDIHMMGDDFVETDGSVHNVRVFNNRGVNAAHGGYSAQPAFGGPIYFIRNILYHVPSGVAFKFSAKPAGLFVYHNTIIGEHIIGDPSANMHFRNNLYLGRDTPGRGILRLANATDEFSTDYNGYRPNRGVKDQYAFLGPKKGQRLYEPTVDNWQMFGTLSDLRAATGQETHSLEVDFDIFEKLTPPDPAQRHAVYHAMDLNFALKPASKAVDAGVVIPTVNEVFQGKAPDLGALEVGRTRSALRPALAHLAAVLSLSHTCHGERRDLGPAAQRHSRFPRGDARVSRLAGRRRNRAGASPGSSPTRPINFLHLSHAVVDGAAPDPRGGARRGRERDHPVARRQRRARDADVPGARAVRVRAQPDVLLAVGAAALIFFTRSAEYGTVYPLFLARHRTHLRGDRPVDGCARDGAARRGMVSHRRIPARRGAVHSPGARLMDRRGRGACRALGLPAPPRRASPGAAVVCRGLRRHARQPVDSVQPRARDAAGDGAAVAGRSLHLHQAVGRPSRGSQHLARRACC